MDKKFLAGMVGVFAAVLFACLLVIDGASIPGNAADGRFAAADALVALWAALLVASVMLVRWRREE
ncbi:MAG: hypothetical protein FJ319_02060 [SAR202 cluster bacterium]|nr:hypothetical protein [SAR202 cluster bacterium]